MFCVQFIHIDVQSDPMFKHPFEFEDCISNVNVYWFCRWIVVSSMFIPMSPLLIYFYLNVSFSFSEPSTSNNKSMKYAKGK